MNLPITCVIFLLIGFSALVSTEVLSDQIVSKDSCACKQTSLEEAFQDAKYVVFGELKEVTRHSQDLASGGFHALQSFKSSAKQIEPLNFVKKVVGSSEELTNCRRVVKPGFYLLFSKHSQNVVLNACSASRLLIPGENLVSTLQQVQKIAELEQKNSTSDDLKGLKASDTSTSNITRTNPGNTDWSIKSFFTNLCNFFGLEWNLCDES